MKAISLRTIQTEAHPQTKALFWFLFAGTKGGQSRIKIILSLRDRPANNHQLAIQLGLDYKAIQHHLKVLEKENIVTKVGPRYGATYFLSTLFEDGEAVFDEIVTKLKKVADSKWKN